MAAGGCGGRFQSCECEQSGAATFDRFVKWSYLCLPSPSRLQPLGGHFRSSWVVLRVPSRKWGLVHLVVEGSHSDLTGRVWFQSMTPAGHVHGPWLEGLWSQAESS